MFTDVQLAMTLSLSARTGAVKLVICGCVDVMHPGTLDGGVIGLLLVGETAPGQGAGNGEEEEETAFHRAVLVL